ncbi:MAG: bifunctional riboflavin kinase/FMN adenylyltransferase [Clostridiales bacterium]|nr:bifunctional riboflavin kinase/FMN adenylyltransferase [Clostridiales bacterium]
MQIITDINKWQRKDRTLVAIGNFDGLHLGHQALLQELLKQSKAKQGISMVLTFEPHPLKVLSGFAPPLLTGSSRKERLLAQWGIDYLCKIPFDFTIADMAPNDFVRDILADCLGAWKILVGFNFTFGHKGLGDACLLQQIAQKKEIEVTIIPAVSLPLAAYRREASTKNRKNDLTLNLKSQILNPGLQVSPVSSTAIRNYLSLGQVKEANLMLGHAFSLEGQVVTGRKIGQALGFPTANLALDLSLQIPARGVYAVRAALAGRIYHGAANVGYRPTLGGADESNLEVCLLDYEGEDFYGSHLHVSFDHFFRLEQSFSGIEQLRQQISHDYQNALDFYRSQPLLAPIWS